MSDKERAARLKEGRSTFVVPADMVAHAPSYYANHVLVSVSTEGASLVFCNKLDLISSEDSNIAVPQAVVNLSLGQADSLATVLGRSLEDLRKAISEHKAAQGATHVEE